MARYNISPSRIARYYFHECDRYLRYTATPRSRKAEEGIPQHDLDFSLVTRAILQGGYDWEEQVLVDHLRGQVIVAADEGSGAPHERRHSLDDTPILLAQIRPGEFLYQPTLRPPESFYRRYGIDPDFIEFLDCYPDLVTVIETTDGPEFAVVDVKASDWMKLAHRIQVGLYTAILRSVVEDAGIGTPVADKGGVWLYEQPEPEWFDLVHILPPLETFLEEDLDRVLSTPAGETFWHLYFKCEWCDYYSHCRSEAENVQSISLLPYLSTFGKRHLEGQAIRSLTDLSRALADDAEGRILEGSASLEGRRTRLAQSAQALEKGTSQLTGASSIAMPIGEQVRIVMTLQSEPLSGAVYGYAINRVFGRDLFESPTETIARVAVGGDPGTLVEFRRQLVRDLLAILRPVHDHNSEHSEEWQAQKSVQAYVFDTYERDLLTSELLEAVLDPVVAEDALALLFHFQRPELAAARDHPADEVFFPIVVLNQVIENVMALPIPVVNRFPDVVDQLAPSQYAFAYQDNEFFTFALSNRMKSNAILEIWQNDRTDLIPSVERELRARVWGANSVVNGIRERLDGTGALFAWPPKFRLPGSLGFRDSTLSRLAFISRYEQVLQYLGIRTRRTASLEERLADEYTIRLTYEGDGRYRVDPGQVEAQIPLGTFHNHIVTRDTPVGARARLAFHDFRFRMAHWTPKNLEIALAAVVARPEDDVVRLDLKPSQLFELPKPGDVLFLDERFTDWLSSRQVEELAELDNGDGPWFVDLLHDPLATRRRHPLPGSVRESTMAIAHAVGLTPSQEAALGSVADHDVELIWGPPGTGKTHFLATIVLAMMEAHRAAGIPFHVLLTAFTHTAIDNLLTKITELQSGHRVVRGDCVIRKASTDNSAPVPTVDPKAVAGVCSQSDHVIIGSTVWQARKTGPEAVAYDLIVIDEGSQLKVAEAAIAVRRLAKDGRIVIAGDDLQLPPIVQGEYPSLDGEPLLHRSILECLRAGDPGGSMTSVLLENWRMNETLCDYPAGRIYPDSYRPATDAVARRRLVAPTQVSGGLMDALLDPAFPMVLCVLENVQATARNPIEAGLVADMVMALRDEDSSDDEFWGERVFVVSPHHAQIRQIRRELARRHEWDRPPFVDTVDKMQGQERDAVIVSYGVADVEYALREKEFIYQLNRLNVSITRGRSKAALFVSRSLLEPPIQALDDPAVANGIAYMQGLLHWLRDTGETHSLHYGEHPVTVYRKG